MLVSWQTMCARTMCAACCGGCAGCCPRWVSSLASHVAGFTGGSVLPDDFFGGPDRHVRPACSTIRLLHVFTVRQLQSTLQRLSHTCGQNDSCESAGARLLAEQPGSAASRMVPLCHWHCTGLHKGSLPHCISGLCTVRRLRYFTDFVLCLGGDGVILHASSLFQTAHPPVGPPLRCLLQS